MLRTLIALLAGASMCAVGLLSAATQEPKKGEKVVIPGGIEGQVKSVDQEKQTLTIVTSAGRERTYSVTDESTMVGPRGGKVRRRLHDPRFHEGLDVTIVADGKTAKEVHLGFSGRQQSQSTSPLTPARRSPSATKEATGGAATVTRPQSGSSGPGRVAAKAAPKARAQEEEDDDDNEIPGKVKSYDPERRPPVLVITLLNGQNRSFFLGSEVKLLVRGRASRLGLKDPAIKVGTSLTVILEPGGRRVKELHVSTPAAVGSKKAG
jgi:hypothetical protein